MLQVGPIHRDSFRQADGRGNNFQIPELRRAGQPYVRSDQTKWRTDATLQDPGLVFDTILKRRKVKKIGYCCYLTIAHASSCLILAGKTS